MKATIKTRPAKFLRVSQPLKEIETDTANDIVWEVVA